MNAAPQTRSLAVPELIAQIIFVLCQTVSMRLRAATVTPAQMAYIVGRLLGIRKRFRSLVARIQAGKPPAERIPKPRPGGAKPDPEFPLGFRPPPPGWRRWAATGDKPLPTWRSLRQERFAWLCPLAPAVPEFRDSAAALGEALQRMLAEPDMQALLRASRRVGDSLRPLCWMLGVKTSILYPARPAASAAGSSPAAIVPPPEAANPMPRESESAAAATAGPFVRSDAQPPGARPRGRDDRDFFATA